MASVELYDGMNPQVIGFKQGDTPGGFKVGDLVTVDDVGILLASSGTAFLGIAREDGDSTHTRQIPVEFLNANSIYVVRHDTSATESTGISTTMIGDAVGFGFTAGAQYVASSLTAAAYIVRLGDTAGTAGGRLHIRFSSTAITSVI